MQALTVRHGKLTYSRDSSFPDSSKDEAIIKILVAGICSTDLEIVKGYAEFEGILGHEFVGLVQEAPESSWQGKRVVGSINIGCQHCDVCLGEGPEHCLSRTVIGIHNRNGAFADFMSLPIDNLYEVPDSVSNEQAVFTEPMAATLRILEQAVISPSEQIAVIGPGKLGMLVAQVLALNGANLTVLGRRHSSLEMADAFGLRTSLVNEAKDNSFDLVVEATGNEAGLAQSLRLVRPQGILVLKSTFSGVSTIDLTKLVVAEIRVIGSRCGPFQPALHLLSRGSVRTQEMIEATYPLSEGVAAFNHASQPGVRKILLRP
jgi:threonine dehydrogenase-like Zn-dependent dehydrogenase